MDGRMLLSAHVEGRVANELRRAIISGKLPAGKRLPTRHLLCRSHKASLGTVQGAVSQLVQEGFLHVGSRKHGTFVAEHPPHLHHYKIVFPLNPGERGEFWRVLHDEAQRLSLDTDRAFSFFYGLSGHREIGAYQEIVEDVQFERIAGLIFASGADELKDTPIVGLKGIPRVAIADSYELPGIPKLKPDLDSFVSQALDHLVARGRRRIAVLIGAPNVNTGDDAPGMMEVMFQEAMAARGLPINPLWFQYSHLWCIRSVRRCAHLLLHPGQSERPDGLIVADDNLLYGATLGIADAGVAAPDDLDVVSMANFPAGVRSVVPVTRIGFDVPAILMQAAAMIDRQRNGETGLPELTPVPVIHEPLHHDPCNADFEFRS